MNINAMLVNLKNLIYMYLRRENRAQMRFEKSGT